MIDPSFSDVEEIIKSLENFFNSLCASLIPVQVPVERKSDLFFQASRQK